VQDVIDTLSDKYAEAGFVIKIVNKTLVGNNISIIINYNIDIRYYTCLIF